MPRPRLPYVQRETSRHGKVVYYFRRGDEPRIRLRGDYGSDEFRAAYALALSGNAAPSSEPAGHAGTIGQLIKDYRASSAWKTLAPSTQVNRERFLRGLPVQDAVVRITRKAVIAGMDRRAPYEANAFLHTLGGLFRWAVYAGHVVEDPTIGVKKVNIKTDGFHVWTDDEIGRFERHWAVGTRERLAIDLLLCTGLRRADAVRVGPHHVRDGVLRFRTAKGGVEVGIPILPSLGRSLAAAPIGATTFVTTSVGRPMKASTFGIWFRKAAIAAGCPGSAHGLRKSSATQMALAGASTAQLKASYGWKTNAMPEHYTQTANRETLARDGMAKLGAGRTAENINDLNGAPEPRT